MDDSNLFSEGNEPTSERSLMFMLGGINAKIDYLVKAVREQNDENQRLERKIDQTHADLDERLQPIESHLNQSKGRRALIKTMWGGVATVLGALGAAIVKKFGG